MEILKSPDEKVVVSILAIAESFIAVLIALTFIHFKYFKSAVLYEILLELNLLAERLEADSVVETAKFSGFFGVALVAVPVVFFVISSQGYISLPTFLLAAFGTYATLLAISTQICRVLLIATICKELFQKINFQLKVCDIMMS